MHIVTITNARARRCTTSKQDNVVRYCEPSEKRTKRLFLPWRGNDSLINYHRAKEGTSSVMHHWRRMCRHQFSMSRWLLPMHGNIQDNWKQMW